MNLIYCCVFYQESYIQLLKLLFETIHLFGNVNPRTTDILVMTSASFLPKIKNELSYSKLNIHYCVLDLNTLMEAGCARLELFNWIHIDAYDKILYLDTDILIHDDLNQIFNLNINNHKIYAMQEGIIGNKMWGGPDFFDFSTGEFDKNTPAFSSGILFFHNSNSIKKLFKSIILQIDIRTQTGFPVPVCLDQPYIVYNAITQDKYDNVLLNDYIVNNPNEINDAKIICHFPGDPGYYFNKNNKMQSFLLKMKLFHSIQP